MTFVSSRRPCDSDALATSSYGDELRPALVGGDLGERRGQRGLAVVDVPDGADVHVRFAAVEFFFGHVYDPRLACVVRSRGYASGADDQDRTGDLVLTKDALCQLSYIGLRTSALQSRRPSAQSRHPARSSLRERRLERETGIEPATNSLEGCDSTTELLPPSRSRALAFAAPAGKPARVPLCIRLALAPSAFDSPARSRSAARQPKLDAASEGWWRGKDSNLRSR